MAGVLSWLSVLRRAHTHWGELCQEHVLPGPSPGLSPSKHLLSLRHHLWRNDIKGLCVHEPKLDLYEKDSSIWALCRQTGFAASLLPLCSQVGDTFLSQDIYGGPGDIKELGWKPKALPTLCANPAAVSWRKWKFLSLGKTLRLHQRYIWPKDQRPGMYFNTSLCFTGTATSHRDRERCALSPLRFMAGLTPCHLKGDKHTQVAPDTKVVRKLDSKSPAQRITLQSKHSINSSVLQPKESKGG